MEIMGERLSGGESRISAFPTGRAREAYGSASSTNRFSDYRIIGDRAAGLRLTAETVQTVQSWNQNQMQKMQEMQKFAPVRRQR
jgi:hypothetical protein